ncbi:MAG: Hsp20/alpha crystallin family protein [Bacteroidales bacterium]|nr:Hsp20/alpha crystallin family protein [Bacteroidales bacterium]
MTLVSFKTQPAGFNVLDQLFFNSGRSNGNSEPSVNIYNQENSFMVELAVPGYAKEDFSINLEQNTLKISAEAKQNEVSDDKYLRREFSLDGVNRNFTLPKSIDTEKISADFRDGMLRIILPRKEETIIKKEISIS